MGSIFLMVFIQLFQLCLYDAKLAQEMSARLLNEGIFVMGFYYPVVPKKQG